MAATTFAGATEILRCSDKYLRAFGSREEGYMPALCQVILIKLPYVGQNTVQNHLSAGVTWNACTVPVMFCSALTVESSLQLQSFGLLLQDHLPVYGLVFQTSTREVVGLRRECAELTIPRFRHLRDHELQRHARRANRLQAKKVKVLPLVTVLQEETLSSTKFFCAASADNNFLQPSPPPSQVARPSTGRPGSRTAP